MAENIENQVDGTTVDGDQTAGKGTTTPKTFTQQEVDDIVKDRLKRAKTKDDKATNTGNDGKAKQDNQTNEKISALETKLLCFEKEVAKESVADVIALAKSYIDDGTNLEQAIDKVIAKYPNFAKQVKANGDGKPDNTGVKSKGGGKDLDGVESAFLKRNPNLKL